MDTPYSFDAPPSHPASPQTLVRTKDGDTLEIRQPVRPVSIDTAEKSYPGKVETVQRLLDETRLRLERGFYPMLPDELREYLLSRLVRDAAIRHVRAAKEASRAFRRMLKERLTREDGVTRKLAIIP